MSKHKPRRKKRKIYYYIPKQWLNYAEDDLTFAKHIYSEGEHYHFALFHAQQAAEKALKAFLYSRRETRELRFHSLARLLKLARRYSPEIMRFWRQAIFLTRYYAPTRYPDVYPQAKPQEMYTYKEAKEAIKTAETIINWVRERIM